jgi:hypothetical protein
LRCCLLLQGPPQEAQEEGGKAEVGRPSLVREE